MPTNDNTWKNTIVHYDHYLYRFKQANLLRTDTNIFFLSLELTFLRAGEGEYLFVHSAAYAPLCVSNAGTRTEEWKEVRTVRTSLPHHRSAVPAPNAPLHVRIVLIQVRRVHSEVREL